MIRGIDHLVIACADPDGAAAELESTLGLASTGGGRHEGLGTHNRLAFLADGSYLELIGVTDARLAASSPIGAATLRALERGGGLATYALRDDAVIGLDSAVHGARQRPDGEAVEWWTVLPATSLAADAPPFRIEHAYAGAEWGPEALAARAAFRHPIGSAVRLVGLDIATADPDSAAANVHEALGLAFRAMGDLAVADVGPHVIRFGPLRDEAAVVVTLAAEIDVLRSSTLLGIRVDVEPA